MIDFQEARIRALEELNQTDTATPLSRPEIRTLGLQEFPDVWQVQLNIFIDAGISTPVILYLAFPDDFPLVLPKPYLSERNRKAFGQLPHVNYAGLICLYDEEDIYIDESQPGQIVKACLIRAQTILEDGLQKRNVNDIHDELTAYWELEGDTKDILIPAISLSSTVVRAANHNVSFLYVKNGFFTYQIIIIANDEHSERLKNFLREYKADFTEHFAFYLGTVPTLTPPFLFTNRSTLQFITNNFPEVILDYKRYINGSPFPKIVLFTVVIKGEPVLFGWEISPLSHSRNGFKPGSISGWTAYTMFQQSDRSKRIKFDVLEARRLQKRTEGRIAEDSYKFAFAGLGSIGSNLLHYMLANEIDQLLLVDPDILQLENINRHLLGMEYIKEFKCEAIKRYLDLKNPLIKIQAKKISIVKIIRDHPELLNNNDYIIVAIGKTSVENYVSEALASRVITKPVFIVWVEPFLIGGHCIYLSPGHNLRYTELFENGLFKYNVIDPSEYTKTDRKLTFREAGCQTSYVPYGRKNITLFLSSLSKEMFKLIDTKPDRNIIISWHGNIEERNRLQIKVCDWAKGKQEETMNITEI